MLSATQIKTLEPRSGRYRVRDARGLYLDVYPTGTRSFRYRYQRGGRAEAVVLGQWPHMSLADARAERERLSKMLDQGLSPAEERRRARWGIGVQGSPAVTVRQAAERYMSEIVTQTRKDQKPVRRILERDILPALGNRPLVYVTNEEVQRLIFARRDAGRPEAAAAMRNLIKRVWDYAQICGTAVQNPAKGTPLKFVTRSRPRKRALNREEIGQFLARLESSRMRRTYKLALRLILLTMCRKSELRMARWVDVDLRERVWNVPPEFSKSGNPHRVYLSDQALGVLEELKQLAGAATRVLPGKNSLHQPLSANALNRAMYRVEWGLPRFTVHDFRRTASTLLHDRPFGYRKDVIEKALNHSLGGIRGVYNVAEYAEERAEMLQAWAQFVDACAAAGSDAGRI